MLSLDKFNGRIETSKSTFTCLDKDIPNLPTNNGAIKPKYRLVNGSYVVVVDTSKVLMFSEEDDRWYEI